MKFFNSFHTYCIHIILQFRSRSLSLVTPNILHSLVFLNQQTTMRRIITLCKSQAMGYYLNYLNHIRRVLRPLAYFYLKEKRCIMVCGLCKMPVKGNSDEFVGDSKLFICVPVTRPLSHHSAKVISLSDCFHTCCG